MSNTLIGVISAGLMGIAAFILTFNRKNRKYVDFYAPLICMLFLCCSVWSAFGRFLSYHCEKFGQFCAQNVWFESVFGKILRNDEVTIIFFFGGGTLGLVGMTYIMFSARDRISGDSWVLGLGYFILTCGFLLQVYTLIAAIPGVG